MKPILSLFLIFLLGCQQSNLNASAENSDQIIGGKNASAKEFPFLVNILMDGSYHICGGSLISDRWVLTAAHCMIPDYDKHAVRTLNPRDLTLVLGSQFRNGKNGTAFSAKSIKIHPKFSWPNHDVALIELDEAVLYFEPIVLYPKDQGRFVNPNTAVVMGWGLTDLNGLVPTANLLKRDVPLVDRKTCNEMRVSQNRPLVSEDMICGITNNNRNATCAGDSGGPLVQIINGKFQQIGIVSWGSACRGANSKGDLEGFSSIYSAYDWIQRTAR